MLRLVALLVAASPAVAADPPRTLPLWPGTPPGEKTPIGPEGFAAPRKGEATPVKRIENVSVPTISVYKPAKDKDTGTAVIVAPGGGYTILAWEHEGTQVAEWLRSVGVTGILLKYRVPRRPDQPKDAPPVTALMDAQRAVSLARTHAKEWGYDPKRVGFLGFSAGGHLTAWVSNAADRAYPPVDDADKAASKPDFAVLIYPGGVVKRGTSDLAPEITVTKDTPPSFLAVAVNDPGPFAGSVAYVKALTAAGVSAELHVYASGGHGFGMKPSGEPYAAWPKRTEEWMRARGLLTKAETK